MKQLEQGRDNHVTMVLMEQPYNLPFSQSEQPWETAGQQATHLYVCLWVEPLLTLL